MEITTLVKDIYSLVLQEDKSWFTDELAQELGHSIAQRFKLHFGEERKEGGTLRLSKMGDVCPKALWCSLHHPEYAELLPAPALIKYAYGHSLEALVITLAKAAGHTVTGEQDAIYVDGVKGHRDCVIDGCVVDVKSASSRMFDKFADHSIAQDDPFGYLEQLDGYAVGSSEDDLVTVKDRAYDLVIDKVLGKVVLYEHRVREEHIRSRIADHKRIAARSGPPECTCKSITHQKSGNLMLDVRARYSAYKHYCNPGLRTFIYSDGPVYLTKVVRKPNVIELDRDGKVVYRSD